MYKEEITQYSNCLERDMHMVIYGHGGVPFLAFPTQDSLCHNYEEFGMISELSEYLEQGKIQYFVVDTIDKESWSEGDWDKGRWSTRSTRRAGRKETGTRDAEPGSRSSISTTSWTKQCLSFSRGLAAVSL